MWVFHLIDNRDIIQFDVQVLVHALQSASNGYVVLELHGDFVVDKRLEEAEEQHYRAVVCRCAIEELATCCDVSNVRVGVCPRQKVSFELTMVTVETYVPRTTSRAQYHVVGGTELIEPQVEFER